MLLYILFWANLHLLVVPDAKTRRRFIIAISLSFAAAAAAVAAAADRDLAQFS